MGRSTIHRSWRSMRNKWSWLCMSIRNKVSFHFLNIDIHKKQRFIYTILVIYYLWDFILLANIKSFNMGVEGKLVVTNLYIWGQACSGFWVWKQLYGNHWLVHNGKYELDRTTYNILSYLQLFGRVSTVCSGSTLFMRSLNSFNQFKK